MKEKRKFLSIAYILLACIAMLLVVVKANNHIIILSIIIFGIFFFAYCAIGINEIAKRKRTLKNYIGIHRKYFELLDLDIRDFISTHIKYVEGNFTERKFLKLLYKYYIYKSSCLGGDFNKDFESIITFEKFLKFDFKK